MCYYGCTIEMLVGEFWFWLVRIDDAIVIVIVIVIVIPISIAIAVVYELLWYHLTPCIPFLVSPSMLLLHPMISSHL